MSKRVRKKMKLFSITILVLSALIASIFLLPVSLQAQPPEDAYKVDLMTIWKKDIGDIYIWNDDENLYVMFVANESWIFEEIHLIIASSPSDLIHRNIKNLIIFREEFDRDDMVTEYTFAIPLEQLSGDMIFFIAHAEMPHLIKLKSIISDSDTLVVKGNDDGASYPYNAVYAWEPYNDSTPSYWDDNVDYDFTPSGADWIWESYRVLHPIMGDIVVFRKDFSINIPCCCSCGATHHLRHHGISCFKRRIIGILHITADNGYEVFLNGHFVGRAQLEDGYQQNLTAPYVKKGWQSVEHYKVSPLLKLCNNNLTVIGVNEYFLSLIHI